MRSSCASCFDAIDELIRADATLRRYHRLLMTDRDRQPDTRPYSPGLEGVIAGETRLGLVDGERGRLLYRGYPIGDLVEHGTYAGGRQPAVDRRVGPGRDAPARARPGGRA